MTTQTEEQSLYENSLKGLGNHLLIERYRRLIRVMSRLTLHQKRRHFNMTSWVKNTHCGTTMCAAGFCGSDRWFRRQGFVLTSIGTVRYGTAYGWSAIHEFFGQMDGDTSNGGYAPHMGHPVFGQPHSVPEVIEAAKQRIRKLGGAP